MTPPPWSGVRSLPGEKPFPRSKLAGSTREAARALLGAVLVSDIGEVSTAGVIVETEAYIGPLDPASHAAERIGRTRRNASMYLEAGTCYVYRIYGMHDCVNVVTGSEGVGLAVLIRALHPLVGLASMERRRGTARELCSGPGRLCQALAIDRALDGHRLGNPPLRLLRGWSVPEASVRVTGRIGIRAARHWPLRFVVKDDPAASAAPAPRPRTSRAFRQAVEAGIPSMMENE